MQRDNVVYLARCVPRMCLPKEHELYEFSHETMLEYVCDSAECEYDNHYIDHWVTRMPESFSSELLKLGR